MRKRLFVVHRCCLAVKEGTQHWFSSPLEETEAKKLKEKWLDPHYTPTPEECECIASKQGVKIKKIMFVKLEPYKKSKDVADGKMHKLTVNGKQYFYQIVKENEKRVATIFDNTEKPLLKFTGDPHDYERNSIKKMIRHLSFQALIAKNHITP